MSDLLSHAETHRLSSNALRAASEYARYLRWGGENKLGAFMEAMKEYEAVEAYHADLLRQKLAAEHMPVEREEFISDFEGAPE